MTVNVTPLHDRVLVRRLEEKETAKGGIIMSRLATGFCSANTPVTRSPSMIRDI